MMVGKRDTLQLVSTFNSGMDNALQGSMKRRVTLDYLSERSGPTLDGMGGGHDLKKFKSEHISCRLEQYKIKNKKTLMTRESLKEFVEQEYGLSMTMLSATDAILFCRGP
jgi:hypothetical protein